MRRTLTGTLTPDQLMSRYFALQARAVAAGSVVIDGMPRPPRDTGTAERLRVSLSEWGWYVQDLTTAERSVAQARALGIGPTTANYRYLVSLADVQTDEEPTGGRHPGDASLIEVRGVRTRAPTYHQLATALGLTAREVADLYNAARRKVGTRLYSRPLREDD